MNKAKYPEKDQGEYVRKGRWQVYIWPQRTPQELAKALLRDARKHSVSCYDPNLGLRLARAVLEHEKVKK